MWNASGIRRNQELYAEVFGLGFLILMIVLLPLMIWDRGLFIYYGDFVSQQLPFYFHAGETIRSGGLTGWDWGTDLGSSFIGSYAFYLTGSPFFWLTMLFPLKATVYLIPWLLAVKHGTAAVTAYAYIRRFVSGRYAAAAGGLLYAFSGFQLFNIFFNHFQDVTAFFPLMLIAMEELVNRNRRGWFAAIVALMASINYFFFAGQVVFLILYFLMRLKCADFHIDGKKFAALATEAVLGVVIAAAVLFPAALAVMGNERVKQYLYGQNMIFYSDKTRILRIIQSFFMIPDAPARPNLFTTEQAKWSSIGGYLPLFSMAGVITFMGQHRKHWATRLLWVCILCAFIPILNSMFYMFNGSYYARWYYMPILLMAMATARTLDDRDANWNAGTAASLVLPVLFGMISLLPVKNADQKTEFLKFAGFTGYFFIVLAITLLCWLGLFYVYCRRTEGKTYLRRAFWLTAVACVACTMTMVYFGKANGPDSHGYADKAVHGREKLTVSYANDEADWFRVDISENCDNYPMFWGLSSMRCFHSVVNVSIMDFYESLGITRDVASRADTADYTLRGLFSVKYYFHEIREDSEPPEIPGFVFDREENGFRIYRNEYYIPPGFTFDRYVTDEALEGRTNSVKERLLIRSLVLTEEQVQTYKDILQETTAFNIDKEHYLTECQNHIAECCRNFTYDAKGFAADITLENPKLVFFSIPYDTGWTAYVNDEPVKIENVDHGFMALRCEAGENHITFRYTLPGLHAGLLISGAGVVLLLLYLAFGKALFSRKRYTLAHSYDYTPCQRVRAAEDYAKALQQRCAYRKGETEHGTSERNEAQR